MAADVVLAVVETDLRLLAAEAKKAEGPMTNLMGMLHHSDLPALKDATEKALQKVRRVEERHDGLPGVQKALEILSPFALACETKYPKLACIALSSFQKLLANDAVSIRGRCEIIRALQAAERLSDESVKLRILQASLTIIQNPSFADEQEAVQQLLSVVFRIYLNNKSNFAVHSTAAATIRQAVALIFDHSVMKPRAAPVATPTASAGSSAVTSPQPSTLSSPVQSGPTGGSPNSPGPPPSGAAASTAESAASPVSASEEPALPPGREVVPVLVLEEIMGWLGGRDGKELGWIQLQQRGGGRVDRTFLLEMLEAVLLQRWAPIHRLPGLAQCLKTKVAPAVCGLLDSACDRLVDPADAPDCRLVVRCAAALVRRHADLAPERAAAVVVRLAETAGSVAAVRPPTAAHRWQRFMALQALRPLLADPVLLYRLYHLAPPADKPSAAAAQGGAAKGAAAAAKAGATAEAASSTVNAGASSCCDGGGSAGGVLLSVVRSLHEALRWYVRTCVETPEDDVVSALGNLYLQRALGARDPVQETEALGTNLAQGSEVVIAHLALECVVAMVAATEALTDVVAVPAEPGMPSPKLITRDTPDVSCSAVAGLVSVLWRCVLAVGNALLARAGHEVLVALLVRALQGITYSAGALGVRDARDALLGALCSHTLLPPGEDDMAALASSVGAAGGAVAGGQGEDRSVGGLSRRATATTPITPSSSSTSVPASAPASSSSAPPAPGFLTALLMDRATVSVRVVLTPRNIAALRALFYLAHRLADGLGGAGWLYVVDAVNALDRILASPHTTTAAYLQEAISEGEAVMSLQPASSMPPGHGTSTAAGAGGGGGGAGGASGAATSASVGAALTTSAAAAAAAAIGDAGVGDGSTSAQRELRILASAADQLFENTHHMSPEAVVSLLSALSDISHRTLAGMGVLAGGSTAAAAASAAAAAAAAGGVGTLPPPTPGAGAAGGGGSTGAPAVALPGSSVPPAPGPMRLCALNRMVDTLLHNLWRIQDLWGIFLAHVLEALSSTNMQVRAAALDALDRTITGALHPDMHIPDKFTAPLPPPEDGLSPESAAAAAKRALLSAFPSFAISSPDACQPQSQTQPSDQTGPMAAPDQPFCRTSHDLTSTPSGTHGGASSSSVSFQPAPARPAGSSRPSLDTPGSLQSPPTPSLSPSSIPAPSPFARTSGAAAATTPPAPASVSAAAAATAVANRGVQQAAQRQDVQHMVLVALDSLYREGGRSPDVRRGLLRIALHVLQHHGEALTRGWVPLLRLLEAVPRCGQDPQEVRLGFQVVELLATDYLASTLAKEHVAKALDVIARFAMQDAVLNVSLTAITMLWNVTDHLARSRGTFSRVAAAANPHHAPPVNAAAPAIKAPNPTSAAAAAAAAASSGPTASSTTTPTAAPTVGANGAAGNDSSPFTNTLYADSATAGGERQMSPAFAAALSFARGVPSLPSVSSQQSSPWVSAGGAQGQQQLQQPHAAQAAAAAPAPVTATQPQPLPLVATSSGGGGSYAVHDLDEAECIALLMIAFRSLKALAVDKRPEARNAAVRTLYLAVCSHGGKFPPATWRELFWSLLFELLCTLHRVSANSSVEEAAAVELGKEKSGRSVVLLVHHSRNSEQKQWDETLVLALAGAGKVLRSYLPVLAGLEGWAAAWEELMQMVGDLLSCGRKGVALAATSLLTTLLQAHGAGPLMGRDMWRQALAAIDRGVCTMAAPHTSASLQARSELLSCITALAAQLMQRTRPAPDQPHHHTSASAAHPPPPPSGSSAATQAAPGSAPSPSCTSPSAGPDPESLLLFLSWLDRFARYPVGSEDSSQIHFVTMGPIQKAVLAALAALPPAVSAAGVWPAVLRVLCNMLRPFSTLALRQHANQAAALQQAVIAQQRRTGSVSRAVPKPPSVDAQPPPTPSSPPPAPSPLDSMASAPASLGTPASARNAGAPAVPGPAPAYPSAELLEARAMSPVWMARVVELLATWYRDHVPWQVRVATFPLLVAALSECLASRHLLHRLTPDPAEQLEELWRTAARGLVTVVQSGLPSVNICGQGSQQQQQVPDSTWPALARAFQMYFLAANLPPLLQPAQEENQALSDLIATATAAGGAAATAAAALLRGGGLAVDPSFGAAALPPPQPLQQQSPERLAADLDITTALLDCLSETVLSSCQLAPIEVRRALVEVLDAGAASAAAPTTAGVSAIIGPAGPVPYDESSLPPGSRLSYVCLTKLFVLCSRGQEQPEHEGRETPGARSQLEVAQLALPVFVSRCEAVLRDYNRWERRTGRTSPSSSTSSTTAAAAAPTSQAPPPPSPLSPALATAAAAGDLAEPFATAAALAALHDKARHVLDLLLSLRVLPAVSDALLPSRPHLRFWLDVSRALRAQAALPPPAAVQAAAVSGGSGSGSGGGAVAGLAAPSPTAPPPPPPQRSSSTGMEQTAGTAAGDASSAGLTPTRSASSSFFSRTYS
ncbi:hypothetical protein Agub_g9147, partial [Astrephomene gubernaculifera]